MNKNQKIEVPQPESFYSEEIQHIIGKEPMWVVRYGTILVFTIFSLLLLGSLLIKYSDVVYGNIQIQSLSIDTMLTIPRKVKLRELYYNSGDIVNQGEVIAITDTEADINDIKTLKHLLYNDTLLSNRSYVIAELSRMNLSGELKYTASLIKHSILNQSKLTSSHEQVKLSFTKFVNINEKLNRSQELIDSMASELTCQLGMNGQQDINLSIIKGESQKKIKSLFEDNRVLMSLLNKFAILSFDYGEWIKKLRLDIESWYKKYTILAPITGTLYYPDSVSKNKSYEKGAKLFKVVSKLKERNTVTANFPIELTTKIFVGQHGFITLNKVQSKQIQTLDVRVRSVCASLYEGQTCVVLELLPPEFTELQTEQHTTILISGKAVLYLESRSLFNRLFIKK